MTSKNLIIPFNLEEATTRIRGYAKWTTAGMIACGVELMWVKKNLKHGEWLSWIEEELQWSPMTISRLMNMGRLYLKEQGVKQIQKATIASYRETIALNLTPALNLAIRSNIDPWGHQPRQLTARDTWLKVYNVWNFAFRDPDLGEEWAGNIPGQIALNVIYYYTKEGDLVVDPMAGGGSTIDACARLNRRCLAYDIQPLEEKGIRGNDVRKDGFPPESKGCDLIFLDPPYYKINRPLYSEESVSALEIDGFRAFVGNLARDCFNTVKNGGFVSFLIQNYYTKFASLNGYLDLTQEAIFYFSGAGFKIVNRINCPQTSQVYSPSDVELAKQRGGMLNLVRDLTIFRKETL